MEWPKRQIVILFLCGFFSSNSIAYSHDTSHVKNKVHAPLVYAHHHAPIAHAYHPLPIAYAYHPSHVKNKVHAPIAHAYHPLPIEYAYQPSHIKHKVHAPIAYGYHHSRIRNKIYAPFNWAGPSVGGYIGGVWGRGKGSTNAGSVTDTSYYNSTANIKSVNQSGSFTLSPNAFIGGIQLSDNFIVGEQFVLGLVMDYGALKLSADHGVNNVAYPDNSGNYSLQNSVTTNWVYTARARLGYAKSALTHPVLLYLTGGLALTKLFISNELTDTTTLLGVGGNKYSTNQSGWTLGAGFEFPIADELTINCEYLYMQFSTVEVNSSIYNSAEGLGIDSHALVNPFNTSANLNANLFRVGLNYKF